MHHVTLLGWRRSILILVRYSSGITPAFGHNVGMTADDKDIPWQVKRLRDLHDEWHRNERVSRGGAEYARILAAKESTLQQLKDQVEPLVAEARERGFIYFRSLRDIGSRAEAIRLQFADVNGAFYERSLGIGRIAAKAGLPQTWYSQLEPAIHSFVRSLDGIHMLSRRMQVKRVRANVATK